MEFFLIVVSIIVTLIVVYTTPGMSKVSVKNIILRAVVSCAVGVGVIECIKQIGGL